MKLIRLRKINYIFRNPEPPGDIQREVIARNLVRGLEKIAKFQIEQLQGESWTHLKVHAPDGLVDLFKRISEEKLKPIIKGNAVFFYIDSNVTALDVRLLLGELIKNIRTKDETFVTRIRKRIGLLLLKVAKTIYPKKELDNG